MWSRMTVLWPMAPWSRSERSRYILNTYAYLLFVCVWTMNCDVRIRVWYVIPADRFNIKLSSHYYKNSHYRDKTVSKPSHLYNSNPYTGETVCSYWINPLSLHMRGLPSNSVFGLVATWLCDILFGCQYKKTLKVVRSSYPHSGISYIRVTKLTCIYWIHYKSNITTRSVWRYSQLVWI